MKPDLRIHTSPEVEAVLLAARAGEIVRPDALAEPAYVKCHAKGWVTSAPTGEDGEAKLTLTADGVRACELVKL